MYECINVSTLVFFYQILPNDVIIHVINHCHEKLLKLKDYFIVTPYVKKLAEPLHQEILDYVDEFSNKS